MSAYHSPKEYLDEAKSPTTSPERLDLLAKTEWEFVRAAVAANPNTNVRTLLYLVPDGTRWQDKSIALALARHADVTPEILRLLAMHYERVADWSRRDYELGLALLSHPATPTDAIRALLNPVRSTPHFRARIATKTDRRDVLLLLSQDVSEKVRKRATRALKLKGITTDGELKT